MDNQRFILLNRLISISKTRARLYTAPTHGAVELLEMLDKRRTRKVAIEYEGLKEGEDYSDEGKRLAEGAGHNFLRLREMRWEGAADETRYVALLFEHINQDLRSFPVVHTTTFQGREIEGEAEERGATAAHVLVRLPPESALNLGTYRCAIEAVPAINRSSIERFLSRQLRREVAVSGGWTFSVTETGRGKRPITKEFKYSPRLELYADVGRKFSGDLTDGRILTSMVFTKRKERQAIGRAAEIAHEDVIAQVGFVTTSTAPTDPEASVLADVEYRVSANQGPSEPAEKRSWVSSVRKHFEDQGYESRLYFRHVTGGPMFAGDVHPAIAGASDLLICPKEVISFSKPSKQWRPEVDPEAIEKMKEILDNDSLWERAE
ncbi:MAG: hypothetical protein ACREE2_15315 [Stellaceae bacterium]